MSDYQVLKTVEEFYEWAFQVSSGYRSEAKWMLVRRLHDEPVIDPNTGEPVMVHPSWEEDPAVTYPKTVSKDHYELEKTGHAGSWHRAPSARLPDEIGAVLASKWKTDGSKWNPRFLGMRKMASILKLIDENKADELAERVNAALTAQREKRDKQQRNYNRNDTLNKANALAQALNELEKENWVDISAFNLITKDFEALAHLRSLLTHLGLVMVAQKEEE